MDFFRKLFKTNNVQLKNQGAAFYYSSNLPFTTIKKWLSEMNLFITPLKIDDTPLDVEMLNQWTMETFKQHPIAINGKNIGTGGYKDEEHFWMKYFNAQNIKNQSWDFIQVYLRFNFQEEKLEKLEKIFLNDSLIVGFIYDDEFVSQQSKRMIGDRKSLRGKKIIKDQWGQEWIDISQNPARITITPHYIFRGGAKMWFGSPFFQFFPKEKLLSFNGAQSIEQIGNLVYLNLYDDIFAGEKKENLKIQQEFRDFLKIDS